MKFLSKAKHLVDRWLSSTFLSGTDGQFLIRDSTLDAEVKWGSRTLDLGIGADPVSGIELFIEGNSGNADIRLHDSAANAASFFDIIHSSDSGAQLNPTNGVTDGNLNFDINATANGTGNSITRFNRSTNVSGTVAVRFLRGDDSNTHDHGLTSGTSGVLADFCRNGGDGKFGAQLGVGVTAAVELHVESSTDPTVRVRDTGAHADSSLDLLNASSSISRIQHRQGTTNGSGLLELDAFSNGSGGGGVLFGRNTTSGSGGFGVNVYRGDNTATIDHTLAGGSSGTIALFCRNGGNATFGGGLAPASFTDANRGAATAVPTGTMIWNTDDGFPNWSDGTNWVDATGTTT